MSKIIEFIQTLVAGFKSKKELDDVYMAKTTDLCELECRMRQLERQSRRSFIGCGLV
ncbi:DUF3563 family protein [Rhodoferax sp.]|uniref:DUF3563 family protein n=1 Tax=Rhodoferax sp. TaxID=50421 RepID=UPI00374DEE91